MRIVWKDKKVWHGVEIGWDDKMQFSSVKDGDGTDVSILQIRRSYGKDKSYKRSLATIRGNQATEIWNKIMGADDTFRPIADNEK